MMHTRGPLFLLILVLGLYCIWPAASFAQNGSCHNFFQSPNTPQEYLEKAYNRFLEKRNADVEGLPTEIQFKNKTYKIVNYLGVGIDGIVVRVRAPDNTLSIMKVIITEKYYFLTQIWHYKKMNRITNNEYPVIGVDFKNRILQFENMRGIPMNLAYKILNEIGAPHSVTSIIATRVAMVGYRYHDQNTLYDIDRHIFVSIDPH